MADDEENGDEGSWVESDDLTCQKCDRPIVLPKHDGPYEYYETSGLHGLICRE